MDNLNIHCCKMLTDHFGQGLGRQRQEAKFAAFSANADLCFRKQKSHPDSKPEPRPTAALAEASRTMAPRM